MAVSVTRPNNPYTQLEPADLVTFGVFHFAGHVPVGKIADFYGLPVPQAEKATPVGDFIADRLPAEPGGRKTPSGSDGSGSLSTM